MNVQVVHPEAAVFDVEITVSNISQPTILAIDNLDYKAELCDTKLDVSRESATNLCISSHLEE